MKVLKYIIFLLICNFNYAQNIVLNVDIKVDDTTVITDDVIATKHGLKSINNDKLHAYNKIKEVTIKRKNQSSTFYLLDAKNKYNSNEKSYSGIGYKVYENEKVELFNIVFGKNNKRILYQAPENLNYKPNREIFIRRKHQKYVYSIGFIDGKGWGGLYQRLKNFFHDCPELFKEKKVRKIRNDEILKIADLYQEICN